MNYKICFLSIFVYNFSIGQNDYSDIVKPKLSFVSNKSEATDISNYVVLGTKDTLYAKYDKYDDLSFLNSALKEDKKNLIDYESIIFQYTDENSKKPMILKQWSCPIVLYLDKNIPKNVRKRFTSFFSQINGIENLSISFTKNINDSNYLIKLVDEPVNGYGDDFEFENEEEKNNYIFTGVKYNLQNDNNSKLYSGILKFNLRNKNEEQLLKQLKQVFFFSLGQFTIHYSAKESSLLSESYNNSDIISDYDLKLLRFHYNIIYDQKINGTTFRKLLYIAKH